MDEKILAVQRMQDYIDEHLFENITLANLSEVSYFSPWYSHRLFKEYTKLTPNGYIRRLRLSKAVLKLRDENMKITDIAYDFGYDSIDGFQRAFFREFGINPKEYAQRNIPLPLFIAYGVKYKDLRKDDYNMEKTNTIFIREVYKPKRKVIIKRGVKAEDYFAYCEEVGCDVWGILTSMHSISDEPVCMWLPDKYILPNTSKYVQGVEVSTDFNGEIPDGFDIIELPESKYLAFQSEPFMEEDFCEAIVSLQKAVNDYNISTINLEHNDDNPRIQLEPLGERGYIELYPVKDKK